MFCKKPIKYVMAAGFLVVTCGVALAQQQRHHISSHSGLSALDKDYLKNWRRAILKKSSLRLSCSGRRATAQTSGLGSK